MGNPLSPLIAEVFMSNFEVKLKTRNMLPRVWHRYVDDIFAVIKRTDLNTTLNMLNEQYPEINFTCEVENEQKLTFLDLTLQRIQNKIEIAVHHKSTSTLRYIPSDSYAPIQHKLAAFHSLAHRLVSLPLSLTNYIQEYEYIKKVAKTNGYSEEIINNIIRKHAHKQTNENQSTLFKQNKKIDKKDDLKRVSITFAPTITNKLKTTFKRNNMEMVFSNPFKLKNLLNTLKDKTDPLDKAGIYQISCGVCSRKYYGQTKRSIKRRYCEHKQYVINNEPRKSAFASHVLEQQHLPVSSSEVHLVKCINDERKLDAYESMYICKDNTALNIDKGNIQSDFFCLL